MGVGRGTKEVKTGEELLEEGEKQRITKIRRKFRRIREGEGEGKRTGNTRGGKEQWRRQTDQEDHQEDQVRANNIIGCLVYK